MGLCLYIFIDITFIGQIPFLSTVFLGPINSIQFNYILFLHSLREINQHLSRHLPFTTHLGPQPKPTNRQRTDYSCLKIATYSLLTQWADVKKWWSEISVAPHWCLHLSLGSKNPRLAIQGQCPTKLKFGSFVAPVTRFPDAIVLIPHCLKSARRNLFVILNNECSPFSRGGGHS